MAKFFYYPFADGGDKAPIPDGTQTNGSVSYQIGWGGDYQLDLDTDPNAKPIPRDQSNQLYFDITDNIRQYQTEATPDYITPAENLGAPFAYPVFARVRYDDGGGVRLYENQVPGNTTDPTDPSWIDISGGNPAGSLLPFAGLTVPDGYLVCDGSAVSRTTYAQLFAAIGEIWGAGDGVNTFNLPNMERRVPVGAGGAAGVDLGNSVGDLGGAEAVALTIAEMPAHDHTGSTVRTYANGNQDTPLITRFKILPDAGQIQNLSLNIATQGGGAAHNNIQPSAVMQWIIKT